MHLIEQRIAPSESILRYSTSTPASVPPDESEHVYGMCTACGALEAALVAPSGTRDFSDIGESHEYPIGYGCEFCT